MLRRLLVLFVALALLAVACGSDEESSTVSNDQSADAASSADDTAGESDASAEPDGAGGADAPSDDASETTEATDSDTDNAAAAGDNSDSGETTDEAADVDEESIDDDADDTEPAITDPTAMVEWQPGVNQVAMFSDRPDTEVALIAADGTTITATTDEFGSVLFRDVEAGRYTGELSGTEAAYVEIGDVSDAPPEPDFYSSQQIGEGFGYVETRDGTMLSATVWLPGGEGPYPTVVEYSGYGPSNPNDSTFALLFNTLGYAYVGVNMRGTGCSGGSFEFFEPAQLLDGYDMIEAIAAQPWVEHNHVGMVGVSYPGISQLFVASTQPPSLAAITPLSVLDDSTLSTLYPGGILNTGFAKSWSDERESDSQPYGQGWEQGIVDGGDSQCADNQRLRLQNTDAAGLIEQNVFYTPELGDPIAPRLLVPDINVPVFLAGSWQDEQTGGHFPAMLDDFTSTPHLFATMVNGSHTESIGNPAILERYVEFLELYVAKRTPDLGAASLAATLLSGQLTGAGVGLPTGDRFTGLTYEEALAAYEEQPPIRILFEDGAADGAPPGAPLPRYEASFDAWPIPEAEDVAWYLGAGGTLSIDPPTESIDDAPPSAYVSDPANVNTTFYEGGSSGIWQADVTYDWQPIPAGSGVEFVSPSLADDTVIIGFSSLDLWLRSSAADTDLEVTISEVRPDGSEVYVQSGWLRASHRALDESASTAVMPVHTHLESDAEPLPDGEFAEMRVEIFPVGHAFRAGSRLRVTVDAPGGARPLWAFDTTIAGGETNEIAHDAEHVSKLVLSVVPGIEVPAEPPACGALRSQPCRDYVSLAE